MHLQDKGRGVDKTEAVRVEMPPPQPTQVIYGFNVSRQRPAFRLRDAAAQAEDARDRPQTTQQSAPIAGFVADAQQRSGLENREETLSRQGRRALPTHPPLPVAVVDYGQLKRTHVAREAPTASGALPPPRTRNMHPPITRGLPALAQGHDTTHARSRSLQRPPTTTRPVDAAPRRSSTGPTPQRDGTYINIQTLQRPPPMAAFIPKHPIGTPHKVLVRSHIDMMSATSVAGMSKETAIGYIPSDTVPVYQPLPEANDIPDSLRPRPLPAVLEPKFKPTPRSNVEPIPFAGSRSELSFLLRRATGSEDFVRQSPK